MNKLLPLLLLSFVSSALSQHIDSLGIEVSGTSREYSFTNKESAFLYGQTNAENTSGWMGFNVFGHEFLDDYTLVVDEQELHRSEALKTMVYPDRLVRYYANGIIERVQPADSLAVFSVSITSERPVELAIVPLFTDGRKKEDFVLERSGPTILIARANHLFRTPEQNFPAWLAIHGTALSTIERDHQGKNAYSPVVCISARSRDHLITFSVGDTKGEAVLAARMFTGNADGYVTKRRERMQRLLDETAVHTDDVRFDKALAWAKLSLDALIMNQVTKGIFAGLPWFNSYWGRDTFISLPGACLVTGRFTEAKQILKSFSAFQERDSLSTNFGRIPNIVTTTDTGYNTADGTPRFVMMAHEYTMRSGDSSFMLEVYPVVLRSIEGTLKYHSDTSGYLVHADAETWMDAVGPEGPWSPRGNRANDIQALWAQQLEAGIWFATQLGDVVSAHQWNTTLIKLKRNFQRDFITDNLVVDHLNADGSKDKQLRPNQIFALNLLDTKTATNVVEVVTSALTYEYGVASLSQSDENFHPYHQFSTYPKDAAYHNGTVWTWLQGPVISALCRFGRKDLAWRVTSNSVNQILDWDAVGTQSELLDALPKPGKDQPEASGTFSQAWNLAEFVRNFYDDYLGIRLARYNHFLSIRPQLPPQLGNVKATINLNGRSVPVEINESGGEIFINGKNFRVGGLVTVEQPTSDGRIARTTAHIRRGNTLSFKLDKQKVRVQSGSERVEATTQVTSPEATLRKTLSLAKPNLKAGLKSLKGPDYPLLPHTLVKRVNPKAKTLVHESDPSGDDRGLGKSSYTYPTNPHFVPGCLDITNVSLSADDSLAFFSLKFRSLSNPGWHPEYGFQLTYVAIAIDLDGKKNSGNQAVPRNSGFVLDELVAYERLVLVGGGIRVEDENGKILAAYVPSPTDVSKPLGNTATSTIEFAVPLSYLGTFNPQSAFTILVGAQDDHGGSGLGEFRTVNAVAGEWNGGGKTGSATSNMYDMMTTTFSNQR